MGMASQEDSQRLTRPLLDEILRILPSGDWESVDRLIAAIEAIEPGNADAALFRKMVDRFRGETAECEGGDASREPDQARQQLPAPHGHSHAVEDMLASVAEIVPFSSVTARLLDLLDDEFSSLEEIARLAATDPVLTGRILRASNAAYYKRRVRVVTMRDAVVVLGAQEVRSIVVATCLMAEMPKTNVVDHLAFWRFSLAVGILADMIARAEGSISGEAFTSGIVHNIGLLVLDNYCPQGLVEAKGLVAEGRRRLHDRELLIYGVTDAEVGARLAARWRLPATVVKAIESHGKRYDEVAARDVTGSAVIRARMYARAQGMSDGLESSPPRPPMPGWLPDAVDKRIQDLGGWPGLLERLEGVLTAVH